MSWSDELDPHVARAWSDYTIWQRIAEEQR
jgi:hypothetical protein